MRTSDIRALRLPLIRLMALLGRRKPPSTTIHTNALELGSFSPHMQRDLGLGS